MKFDPHGKAKRLRSAIEKLKAGTYPISKANSKLIVDFHRDLVTENLSAQRLYKYVETLIQIAKKVKKPIRNMTKNQIKAFVIEIASETRYSQWTKHDYKCVLRRVFKWLRGNNEFYPEEVSWIKIHVRDQHKLPEDLLTEEEVKRIISETKSLREKALIHCLYESGCRISELLTLQLKNIKFDEYGAVIIVSGKTGDRRVRLVASVPALASWLDAHPYKDNPEAYFFVRKSYRSDNGPVPYRYTYAARIIKNLAKQVGIKKRVHMHLFRHSRATALANKLTEAQMKEYFGWVQGSDMAATYVHLSGRDVDKAILGLYGLKKDEKKEKEKFAPVECPRCSLSGSPASKFCTRCGYPLSVDAAMGMENGGKKANSLMNQLMKDPEFREIMLKKIMEKGLGSEIFEVKE